MLSFCFSLQLALDMWRKLMIEPLQAVLIRMLLNEIKKYVYSDFFSKNFFSFIFLPKNSLL